jgi:hypothetical protein
MLPSCTLYLSPYMDILDSDLDPPELGIGTFKKSTVDRTFYRNIRI